MMRTWRREYLDGGVATVIETPNGFVAIYLPRGEDGGLVRVVWSLDEAEAFLQGIAGEPVSPWEWLSQRRGRGPEILFLTQDDCTTAALMRERLAHALMLMGLAGTYRVVDMATLSTLDPRRGYGPPTVLVDGQDLFGRPEPRAAFPAPT